MFAFIVILVFIIIGFALIFLEFARDNVYGVQVYSTYQVLYGNVPEDVTTVSQQLFAALILFLLNVVLLNLLISIMGDSFDKVQERRILTDSLTRLDIVLESMTYMRVFGREEAGTRGYLIFYEGDASGLDDEGENNEWEGWVNVIKKGLRQNDQKIDEMGSKQNEVSFKMNFIQNEMSSMRNEMNSMRNELSSRQNEVTSKQNEVSSKVNFIQSEMNSMRNEIKQMEEKLAKSHNQIMEAIKAQWK